MRYGLIMISILLMANVIVAQDADSPGNFSISYDNEVTETITDTAFFDWWQFSGQEGDIVVVEMTGQGGLAPLIGLLDGGGNLLTSSDLSRIMDINETAVLEFTLTEAGSYTIVATRNGINEGDTTGSYTLLLLNANESINDSINYQEVEFRCRDLIVTSAAVISFDERVLIPDDVADGQITESYRLTVFGLDDFQPIIRVNAPQIVADNYLDCTDNADALVDSTFTLPDGSIGTVTADTLNQAAQLTLTNSGPGDPFGLLDITIGSLDGTTGRYMAVLEGLSIAENNQVDFITLSQAPKSLGTNLLLYMVGDTNNRLDPYIVWESTEDEIIASCDDASRRGCEDVLSFEGAGITIFTENTVQITGDRFDAGLQFNTNSTDPIDLQLMSRENNTSGNYALVIIGELPATEE